MFWFITNFVFYLFSCWPIQDPGWVEQEQVIEFSKTGFIAFLVSLLMNHLEMLRATMMAMLLTTVMVWVGMPSTCFSTLLVYFEVANCPFPCPASHPFPAHCHAPAQCSKSWMSGVSSTYGGRAGRCCSNSLGSSSRVSSVFCAVAHERVPVRCGSPAAEID